MRKDWPALLAYGLARKFGARARIAQFGLIRFADAPLLAIMCAIDGRYAVIGDARDGQFLIRCSYMDQPTETP